MTKKICILCNFGSESTLSFVHVAVGVVNAGWLTVTLVWFLNIKITEPSLMLLVTPVLFLL